MPRHFALAAILFAWITHLPLPVQAGDKPPDPPREFRGVWVATVDNIDWPSKKGLSSAQQQAELRAIFDKAAELRLNAVIFQVRPMCDALYESKVEPWSEYLTGTMGQAPSPGYDPLELAVKEAHSHGIELHAWFNPYRARHSSAASTISEGHIIKRRPELVKQYGSQYWLNPTREEVQSYTTWVILDVVRRYDIDGVHIDDYFYPYPEKGVDGKVIPFPDDDTYYIGDNSTRLRPSRDDWRRDAVNQLIERMYREVKQVKPWVKIGISPFGIWRPNNPPGIAGFDAYTQLYADSRLWLEKGWCDYLSPQLYWPIKQEKQSFPRLLDWWSVQNEKGRHLWPGLFTSRVTGKDKSWPADEIVEQIKLTREHAGAVGPRDAVARGASGHVHFSMRALMNNTGGIADALKSLYNEQALVPATPWTNEKPSGKPSLLWENEERVLSIRAADDGTRSFVVRARRAEKWTIQIVPVQKTDRTIVRFDSRPDRVVVTSINRAAVESEAAER